MTRSAMLHRRHSTPSVRSFSRRHLALERLERREVMDGAPVAVPDFFAASEDQVLSANVLTGAGGDQGTRLIVTEVNGQATAIGQPIALPSGATLTMQPDGTFAYDPTTSPALGSLATGLSVDDSFTYSVASGFSNMYVFGDSLSDMGRLFAATGGMIPPAPIYANGRLSNGPVWAEYVADDLNLELNLGNNFAIGGASTGTANVNELRFSIPDLPGLQDEIGEYVGSLGGGAADPAAVYFVWAGANDFFLPFSDPTVLIGGAITNIATAVGTLQAVGAQHIVVPTLPDLGLTPYALATGQSANLSLLSGAFNQALVQTMSQLFPSVVTFDVFTLLHQAVADGPAMGLTDTTTPYFDDVNLILGQNPEQHFFWDTVHPSTRVHEYLADNLRAMLVNQASLLPSAEGTVTVQVNDVTTQPVLHVSPARVSDDSGTVSWTLAAADASLGDGTALFNYWVDWGNGDPLEIITGPAAGVEVEQAFDERSVSQIRFSVVDRDGDASAASDRVVAVGTSRHDTMTFSLRRGDELAIRINGRPQRTFDADDIDAVIALGLAGRDTLLAAPLAMPFEMFGGSGDDILKGGRADDLLLGGTGRDILFGCDGDDILHGGDGRDILLGGLGDDELFGELRQDYFLGGPGLDQYTTTPLDEFGLYDLLPDLFDDLTTNKSTRRRR